jgi:hypothetical protein
MAPNERKKRRIDDFGELPERELNVRFGPDAVQKIMQMADHLGITDPEEVVKRALELLWAARDSRIILEDKETRRKKIVDIESE